MQRDFTPSPKSQALFILNALILNRFIIKYLEMWKIHFTPYNHRYMHLYNNKWVDNNSFVLVTYYFSGAIREVVS